MAFTGSKDADILILLELDDVSLGNFCLTNKYIKSLCDDDLFWARKLIKVFSFQMEQAERAIPGTVPADWDIPTILNQVSHYLQFDTWREFYDWFVNEYNRNVRGWFQLVNAIIVMKEDLGDMPRQPDYADESSINEIISRISVQQFPKWVNKAEFLKQAKRDLFTGVSDIVSDRAVYSSVKRLKDQIKALVA